MKRIPGLGLVLALLLPLGAFGQQGFPVREGQNCGGTTGNLLGTHPNCSSPGIILDFADDGSDESIALIEIAVTGDDNSAFIMPLPNKLLIDVAQPWPAADAAATATTATSLATNPDNCVTGLPTGVDASGVAEGCTPVLTPSDTMCFYMPVAAPQDLPDADRDAVPFWENPGSTSFTITSWKGWSTADNTSLTIVERDADGVANPVNVDVVELATGTTRFTGTDATPNIANPTIESGHTLFLDFDDTDAPSMVFMKICGNY